MQNKYTHNVHLANKFEQFFEHKFLFGFILDHIVFMKTMFQLWDIYAANWSEWSRILYFHSHAAYKFILNLFWNKYMPLYACLNFS